MALQVLSHKESVSKLRALTWFFEIFSIFPSTAINVVVVIIIIHIVIIIVLTAMLMSI